MKMKRIETKRVKYPIPSWAFVALIGDEDRKEKQKRTKREKQGAGAQPSYLDHSFSSYDVQESYGEPILFTSPAHRGNNKIYS